MAKRIERLAGAAGKSYSDDVYEAAAKIAEKTGKELSDKRLMRLADDMNVLILGGMKKSDIDKFIKNADDAADTAAGMKSIRGIFGGTCK